MGKRGPPKRPTAILQLEGSRRGRQRARTEATPAAETLTPPDYVAADPVALACWEEKLPRLQAVGLCSALDVDVLARYSMAASTYRRATEFLAKHGDTYAIKNKDGGIQCFAPWPQCNLQAKASAEMSKLGSKLGLSPADRAGLKPDSANKPATPQQELSKFGAKRG